MAEVKSGLMRSNDRMLAGVCGGVAEWLVQRLDGLVEHCQASVQAELEVVMIRADVRCDLARERCAEGLPALEPMAAGDSRCRSACFFSAEVSAP